MTEVRRSFSFTGSAGRSRTGRRLRPRSPRGTACSSPTCRATAARGFSPRRVTSTRWPTPCSGSSATEELRGAVWIGHSLGGARRASRRGAAAGRRAWSRPRRGGRDRLRHARRPGHAGGARRHAAGSSDRSAPPGLGQLAARPPRCVRLVGGGRSRRARARAGGGVPRRPGAPHRHAPGRPCAPRLGPAHRARPRHVPVPLPLGRERQLGPARRRDGVRAPPTRPAADDRRLRPPADRRAAGRLPRRDPGVRRLAWSASPPRPAPRTESPRRRRRPPRRASGRRRGTRPAGRPPRSRSAACLPPPTSAT